MNGNSLPIIRMELEGVRATVATMLTQYSARMDKNIKDAVDAYCTEDNLTKVINSAVNAALDHTIKESLTTYFRWGEGKSLVDTIVKSSVAHLHQEQEP